MTATSGKTALVTGANSGIGFEASAQLAEEGFSCVILACRTLEKAEADDTTGHFFASPPGKMVGALEVQQEPHFHDRASQDACWNVVVRLAGDVDYPAGVK